MTEVYTIAPASSKALWAVGAILVFLLAMAGLFAFFTLSSQATRYELSPEGLRISRTMYGRTIPWANVDFEGVRAVNLHLDQDLQPTLRTNGIGLPGYQAGWFDLRKGRGLLFVTDPTRAVAIPTRDDYTVLLSVADPSALLASIRRFAAQPGK